MARLSSPLTRLSQRGGLAVAFAALILAGCGQSKGNVKGTVYYKDKALTSGVVTFVADTRSLGTANIQPDGSYTLKNVPAGEVTVLVTSGPAPPSKSGEKPTAVQVPKDYSDPAKSKERYTVTSGDQEHDIRLK